MRHEEEERERRAAGLASHAVLQDVHLVRGSLLAVDSSCPQGGSAALQDAHLIRGPHGCLRTRHPNRAEVPRYTLCLSDDALAKVLTVKQALDPDDPVAAFTAASNSLESSSAGHCDKTAGVLCCD